MTATIAKHPDVPTKIAALRSRMQAGELDRQAMQAETQKSFSNRLDPASRERAHSVSVVQVRRWN